MLGLSRFATLSPANGTRRQSSIDTLQKKGRDRRWDRSSGKTYHLLTHSASQEKSHKSAYIPELRKHWGLEKQHTVYCEAPDGHIVLTYDEGRRRRPYTHLFDD